MAQNEKTVVYGREFILSLFGDTMDNFAHILECTSIQIETCDD